MSQTKKFKLFGLYRPKSITSKFFGIVLPPVVVSFLVISIVAGFLSYYDTKNAILRHAELNAKSYSKSLGLSLWNLNNTVIDSQIKSVLNNPDISGVKVIEILGKQEFKAGDVPDKDELNRYIVSAIDIVYAAFDEPEVLGVLYLYSEKKKIYNNLGKRFLRDALLFLILVVTVIFSALFANHHTIMIPMRELIDSIHRFNKYQELKPAISMADDEIGQVISAYNGLILSLDMGNTQIKDALKKSREANKIKGEFLANMSHEIRTPLNGIMGMADLLNQTDLSLEQQNLATTVYMESESLLNIINDILDFSKIEAGKLELEAIEFDLRHTLENLCAAMAVNANRKGIELIHYLGSDSCTQLIGDPGRLRQIFVNLIGNAIKFTHEGEVFLKGEMIEKFDQKVVFLFTVKDTGVGIPKDKQDTIFDSFSQADGSTTRKYGGTGLGITIAKMLVEKMGGRIGLRSEPEQGTEFWFELEFYKQPENCNQQKIPNMDVHDLTLFVVDDVKTSRDVVSKYFESWGGCSITCSNGEQALAMLKELEKKKQDVDVILIDFSMPSMKGQELAKKIRTLPVYKHTPLIVLAAIGMPGDGKKCSDIGVDGYLTKPIRQEDLKTFINYVLGNTSVENKETRKLVTRHTLAEARRKNIRLLLVEDYETNQVLVTKQLELAGFNVILANNGKEAVQLYKDQSFDIILMDIQMPVMDGYEATARIRKIENGKVHTPIIAMTAHAIKGYQEECINAGMDDYITKPLKREVLISTVSKWIQNDPLKSSTHNYYIRHPQKDVIDKNNIIDLGDALKEFDNDEDFFYEVFDGFIETVGGQIHVLEQAVDSNDCERIKIESHSIKGGAANILAIPLSKSASKLEQLGISGKIDEAAIALGELKEQFEQLKDSRKKN